MAKKHFENIIGKIIYGTLLFMPLMAVGVTCAYAICNKNAYKSTDNEYAITEINNLDQLETGKNYVYKSYDFTSEMNLTEQNNLLYVSNVEYNGNTYDSCSLWFYSYSSSVTVRVYLKNLNDNTMVLNGVVPSSAYFEFVFESSRWDNNTAFQNIQKFYKLEENTLDNIFYKSINKVQSSPLFNWTTETAINDVIHQTTTTLGINNSFVDLLLTYWLLMTIIYVIYDLGLMLIQIAHKKVHKICDKD